VPRMFGEGFAGALRGLIFGFLGSDGRIEACLLIGEVGPAGEGWQELRIGTEGIEGDPGVGGCSSPGCVDEADRDVFTLGDFASEEVGDGGEIPSGVGRAECPVAGLVGEGEVAALAFEAKEADAGLSRVGNLGGLILERGVGAEALQRKLHVALA